jgi:hypothetical protein
VEAPFASKRRDELAPPLDTSLTRVASAWSSLFAFHWTGDAHVGRQAADTTSIRWNDYQF